MVEYQTLTENLRDNYTNFKNFILYSLDAEFELIKNFKSQQQYVIKALASVIQSITSSE